MSKLMRGDWDDEQMRDIFDVRVDLSQELEAHHRSHHLATADADADNDDGDDNEAVEKYSSDVKARTGMCREAAAFERRAPSMWNAKLLAWATSARAETSSGQYTVPISLDWVMLTAPG